MVDNGFHDTANAVTTVIYTRSLPAEPAVIWSGFFNFLGVLTVERRRRLQHRLAAARRAAPAGRLERRPRDGVRAPPRRDHLEPRHLVSRPAGLQFAHADRLDPRRRHRQLVDRAGRHRHQRRQLDARRAKSACRCSSRRSSASGAAALLLLVAEGRSSRNPALYVAPKGRPPPPLWIRGVLIVTCAGVSFAHGSNDGQKGMGLILLILIGVVPTASALNRMPDSQLLDAFNAVSTQVDTLLHRVCQAGLFSARPRRRCAAMRSAPSRATRPTCARCAH